MILMTQVIAMKLKHRLFCYIFLVFGLIHSFANLVQSQELSDLSNSIHVKNILKTKSRSLPTPDWLNINSNYVKLYQQLSSADFFKALILSKKNFKIVRTNKHVSVDHVKFSLVAAFVERKSNINLSLFIPHPAVLDLAKSDSLPALHQELNRPKVVLNNSKLSIKNTEFMLEQYDGGGFFYLSSFPMESKLTVRSNEPADYQHSKELLSSLNYQWLVEQLSS
jgi:hypothetical protein